ncbi:MAG: biotin/lipoyl-containing protein [bacterium]
MHSIDTIEMSREIVKKLIEIFDQQDLQELEVVYVKNESNISLRVHLKRRVNKEDKNIDDDILDTTERFERQEEIEDIEEDTVYIKAPISGNFYTSPFPGAEPFVTEGQTITKGQVVCIIESMKVLNEIESPYSGVVKKILVNNSSFVKEGDPIILLKQNSL